MARAVSGDVRKRRAAWQQAGLRRVQLLVPDTRRPGFAQACRRQSERIQNDMHEQETLDWIEGVSDNR